MLSTQIIFANRACTWYGMDLSPNSQYCYGTQFNWWALWKGWVALRTLKSLGPLDSIVSKMVWSEGSAEAIIMANCDSVFCMLSKQICTKWIRKKYLENPGIDPGTSHMLSERSTIWANPPTCEDGRKKSYSSLSMLAVRPAMRWSKPTTYLGNI